jgi:uncharacterized membrane protein YciS (DUF1049 family)
MQRFLRIFRYGFFVLIALIAALAMMDNRESVALRFLGYSSFELSLYWWLVAAFLIGFLAGWLFAAVGAVRAKVDARAARRALARNQTELDRLHSVSDSTAD